MVTNPAPARIAMAAISASVAARGIEELRSQFRIPLVHGHDPPPEKCSRHLRFGLHQRTCQELVPDDRASRRSLARHHARNDRMARTRPQRKRDQRVGIEMLEMNQSLAAPRRASLSRRCRRRDWINFRVCAAVRGSRPAA